MLSTCVTRSRYLSTRVIRSRVIYGCVNGSHAGANGSRFARGHDGRGRHTTGKEADLSASEGREHGPNGDEGAIAGEAPRPQYTVMPSSINDVRCAPMSAFLRAGSCAMDCSPIHGRLWRAELLSALPSALLFWSSSSPPVREASECVRNSRCCGVLHVKSRPRVLGGLTIRAALRAA